MIHTYVMPPSALLVILALAFFSGPTAFILLHLLYRREREAWIRSLSFALLGLSLILLGNGATVLTDSYLRLHDFRYSYLIMNEVFLATMMTAAYVCRLAHEATGKEIKFPHKLLFAAVSLLLYALNLSLPLYLDGRGYLNADIGYFSSTILGSVCIFYAAFLILARRSSLPADYRRLILLAFAILTPLSLLSVLNDLFHFGVRLRGQNIPFSPFFLLLINGGVIVGSVRRMAFDNQAVQSRGATSQGQGEAALESCGFTGRERELIPLIVQGLSNEEIGRRLFISPHTVKNHVTSIYRKAGVANRFELLRLVSSPPS